MKLFSKNNLRVVISLLLAFVLCLGVFMLALTATLSIATQNDYVADSAKRSGYAKQAHSELIMDLNYLAIPSGLPQNFFNGKIDYEKFEKSFFGCLENSISPSKNFTLDFSDVETEILSLITEYSENVVGELSPETEQALEDFAAECVSIYASYVKPPLVGYVFSVFAPMRKYLLLGIAVSVVLSFAAGYLLFKLNDILPFKKYCFASFMGAALTTGIIPFFLVITNEISKLSITTKSLHQITTCYINDLLWLMIIAGTLLALVSVMFIIFNKIKLLIFKK